ncbi:hypothetical protein SISNIDRAFT_490551 [Sistotremastrum niveocremeum HHB9708]|uniref:F-box domain-containing protein n=1 Tax=Sistotremastrum niveocremeum HHB9708 TaxID=1314777 RepID=A0A164NTY2_9AGAM|nr:hypothetical protein SISNIDRAFT_490551 [Sistotremastrum niveocremeum HHB9708]
MSFNDLPAEIYGHIIKDYETENLDQNVSAKNRLKRTLTLCHITTRFRQAALAHDSLWSTIHLHWPSDAVDLYLAHSERHRLRNLSIFLDTRSAGTRNMKAKQERWASFLSKELKNTASLSIKIQHKQGSPALVDALNRTSAPRLIDLAVDLDQRAHDDFGIRSLLACDAPLLKNAHIHANLNHNLHAFTSMRKLVFRIGHHNFKGLMEMLANLPPSLRMLRLKGVDIWDGQLLPRPPTVPILLDECTHLSIEAVEAHRVDFILSNISFPRLSRLQIFEEMVEMQDNTLSLSIFGTLPRLVPSTEPRDWLYLGLFPKRLIVEIQGYRFQSDWKKFEVLDPPSFQQTIIRAFRAPATTIFFQPPCLTVENAAPAHEHPHITALLEEVLRTYPSTQSLEMKGNATPIVQLLCDAQPVVLPNLVDIRTTPMSGSKRATECDPNYIAKLKQTRQLELVRD